MTLDELLYAGEVCAWPKLEPAPRFGPKKRRVTSDTTKVNMGRRKNPMCTAYQCRRRVDAKGDEVCRVCLVRRAQG